MPGPVESSQVPALPVESSGPLPADLVAAPATPAAPAAASEPARIPPAPAPLIEPRPVSRVGGFLSAIAGRVLGNTPEPPAPAAGPAPLDMPWARHPASPAAGEQDSAGEYEPAPAPLSVQRAVTAPGAPPAAPAAVSTPPPAAAAPVADSGPAVAMPAIPAQGDQFAVPVPGDLAAVPEAPAWVSTPAPAFDQPAGELAEAPAALPWMDLDSMTDVLARVQTPLVSTTPLSAGQGGLGSRIWGAFERALPGGGAPAAPIAYAWGAGSPVAPGAVPAAFVPAQPGGYRGPSMGSAASLPAYGPGAVAGIPAAGPGGPAPLLGRSPADFVPALSARSLTPAVPAPYFDAESAGEADAEVADPAQAWMAALDRMYGAPAAGSETMPLAVPYGGFVVPAAEASGVLPQAVAWVADTIGFQSAPPAATPARRVWERPVAGPPAPMSWAGGQGPGFVPSLPGSAAPAWIGDTGSAEYDSEAAAWADVVAAAVESDYGAGVPALALAGEEQGVPAVQDAASGADHEAAGDAAGDLDELANSVYEIIRRRLEVERERDWA
jgi:hypothetical protein